MAAVTSFETMMGYSGEVDACIMKDSLKRECGIGAAAVADVQERRLRQRRQQLVRGVRGEDRRTLVILRIAMHRMPVAIQRIEARVRIPGFVEMDAIDARIEQLLHAFRVVAKAVVGGVRDDRVHRRACSTPFVTSELALIEALRASFASRAGGIGPMIP